MRRRCTTLLAVAICAALPTGVAADAQTGGSSGSAAGTVTLSSQQPPKTTPITAPRHADHPATATRTGHPAASLATTGADTLAEVAAVTALVLVGIAARSRKHDTTADTTTFPEEDDGHATT
jgi:hypothetical protein